MELTTSIRRETCPLCNSKIIAPVLKARDHTVSGQYFEIWECGECSLRFTQDYPTPDTLPGFYESEKYISHSETNKGWVNQLYHLVRSRTLQSKRHLVTASTGKKQGRLLDVGAGTGAFTSFMQGHGWQASGLEPDQTARKNARDNYKIELAPIESLFDPSMQDFNAVTLWHVLEHVQDMHAYMKRLKEIISPEGRLLVAVPNYTSLDADVYEGFWAAYDVPRHLYHFSPAAMERLLRIHGLILHEKKPMWYDSFYISLLSEKYKTGKTRMIPGFWTGLRSNWKAMRRIDRCSSLVYIIGK
jgi:SAM-dependent methyltransferase